VSRQWRSQRGLTLIELMVALVAGLLLAAAGTTLLVNTLRADSENMRYTQLNQDLRSVMNVIKHDLARAGHWVLADQVVHASKVTDLDLSDNSGTVTASALEAGSADTNDAFGAPFSNAILQGRTLIALIPPNTRYDLTIDSLTDASTLQVTIPTGVTLPESTLYASSWTIVNPLFGIQVNDTSTCVTVSYDEDGDGLRGNNEQFGYRYDSANQAIETATSAADCTTGSWQDLTDPDVLQITQFTVTRLRTTAVATNQLNAAIDEYVIQIQGRLTSDDDAVRSLQDSVKVRNTIFN